MTIRWRRIVDWLMVAAAFAAVAYWATHRQQPRHIPVPVGAFTAAATPLVTVSFRPLPPPTITVYGNPPYKISIAGYPVAKAKSTGRPGVHDVARNGRHTAGRDFRGTGVQKEKAHVNPHRNHHH